MLLEDDASYAVVLTFSENADSNVWFSGGKRGLSSGWGLWRVHSDLEEMHMFLLKLLPLRFPEMPLRLQRFRMLPT
jgi:hypothetical protein